MATLKTNSTPVTSSGGAARLDRCEVTLIGISSFPKGAGGFVEVYYPEPATKSAFTTPFMPQATYNFNTSGTIKFAATDVDPRVLLKYRRKRHTMNGHRDSLNHGRVRE